MFHKVASFLFFQILLCNNCRKLLLFFFCYKGTPLQQYVRHVIDALNEGFNQCFLAAQLRAGIHGFLNGDQHFFIVAMGIMVFFNQHQDIVDIDLYLLYQLNFKDNIVCDVLFVAFGPTVLPFIPKVLIPAQVVLEVPFGKDLIARKFIKGTQQIPHTQYRTEQHDKIPLPLLSRNTLLGQREFCRQFLNHILIAGMFLSTVICVAEIIVFISSHHNDSPRFLVAKERNGIIGTLLQIAEAHDISEYLDGIQDAVGAGIGLDQTVHF